MLIGGMAGSIVNVTLFTAIQRAIPAHLMGRVMGLLLFGSFGVYPFSVALAGVLSTHLGPASFFPISGLLLALAMLFGLTQRASSRDGCRRFFRTCSPLSRWLSYGEHVRRNARSVDERFRFFLCKQGGIYE